MRFNVVNIDLDSCLNHGYTYNEKLEICLNRAIREDNEKLIFLEKLSETKYRVVYEKFGGRKEMQLYLPDRYTKLRLVVRYCCAS